MSTTLGILGVPAALLILIWFAQRRLIYFPTPDVPPPHVVGLPDAQPITFGTSDGLTLNGWFLRAEGSPRFTVLVFNGNAGNRAHRADLAAALRAQGLAVVVFDYRGFGENPGAPTESGLAADARAARAYLETRQDVDPAKLVYFGESLGAAVAVELAVTHTPAALILRSPFTSMVDVGRVHYPLLPVRLLLRDRYPSISRVPQVRCPLLVVAGDRDSVVPIAQSRQLYAAAGSPKALEVVEGADHNDEALFAGDQMMRAIARFLEQVP